MKLETIAKGCWSFQVVDPVDGTSINFRVHARDADGQPCHEPSPALVAAAEAAERNAPQLRDEFIQQIGCPDPDDVVACMERPVTGFTRDELLNPSEDVLLRLQKQTRLLHISIEQFPGGLIDTYGYVVDAWSRVWEVGDDYIEGWFELDSLGLQNAQSVSKITK